MTMYKFLKAPLGALALLSGLAGWATSASATTVQIQTVMGDIEVNLFDNITPETVANFLEYVEAGAYTDTFIHRSMPNFIVQGGGFRYDGDADEPVIRIPANAPVVNEPHLSNVRGTIAMAKREGLPNSATIEWFINLSDNSRNLDNQNGGFTVFGQVTGNGMGIVDTIAGLNRFSWRPFDSPLENLPLRNYGAAELEANVRVTDEHFVMIDGIVVLDASPDTAADLDPAPTTRSESEPPRSSSGSSGGVLILMLLLLAVGRRTH